MRYHDCPACGEDLFFRNSQCVACGTEVTYDPATDRMLPLSQAPLCSNAAQIGCNWASGAGDGGLCHACAMTDVVPDQSIAENVALWAEAERAKRWVLANLHRWGWLGPDDTGQMPVFRMLSEETREGETDVVMGHAGGVVTINVAEADPAERESRRQELGERYRTMIGHFRHELAHFMFERLAEAPGFLEAFRALFGDETASYGDALKRHYAEGPPEDWAERFVTRYASAHPHEDWAESFAHLLHMVDMVDSAAAAGLAGPGGDPYRLRDSDALIERGMAFGVALNHVNRSMGFADIYPFVLGPVPRAKIAFVHRVMCAGPGQPVSPAAAA